MNTPFDESPAVRCAVSKIAAQNRFGVDADLDDPAIVAFRESYEQAWAATARRQRVDVPVIFEQAPNAWDNSDVVYAMLDAGVENEKIIATLRGLPTRRRPQDRYHDGAA